MHDFIYMKALTDTHDTSVVFAFLVKESPTFKRKTFLKLGLFHVIWKGLVHPPTTSPCWVRSLHRAPRVSVPNISRMATPETVPVLESCEALS